MGNTVVTVNDLVTLAALGMGAIAQNETLPDDELANALQLLTDIIDDWNTQDLLIYTIQRYPFTVPAISQTFTLGVGGDFDPGFRPNRIERANVIFNTSENTTELPMEIVTYDEWSRIIVKGVQSVIPQAVWFDYQYPLINVNVWPIPNGSQELIFYMWQPVPQIASGTDTLALPPGYKRALRYQLQCELCPLYGKPIDASTLALREDAVGNVKTLNYQSQKLLMRCDNAMLPRNQPFNWYTGDVGNR